MRMHILDWLIICVPLVIVFFISWYTRRYMKSVADFLAASRSAGRYLVATSLGAASYGAITAVMNFEIMGKAGMTVSWWETVLVPVGLFIALSGFVIYRYRETRVMTLAQFFEVRYSRHFRIFAGLLCFLSGLINYAIFPAVAARFFVNYMGLPQNVMLNGHPVFPMFGLVMFVLLGLALYLTLMGGQLTVMVNDATEGLISNVFYLVVAFALLFMFDWGQIFHAVSLGGGNLSIPGAAGVPTTVFNPPAGSQGNWMVDPFDSPGSIESFNIWYVLIGVFWLIYGYMAWQGNQAFNCSAANPHEAKMGNILGSWRVFARTVMITLLGLCALTVLRSPDRTAMASQVVNEVSKIDQAQIRSQMLMPVTLGFLLPVGIKGCFAAIMLFAMLACDGSYLHSWGSIFIQDVIMPFRRRPLTARQHIGILRWSITGVAVFAFMFSLLFQQTEAIRLFFDITGAIFIGGAGAAIIGGLYWSRSTKYGAWAAMLLGAIVPVLGIIVQQIIVHYKTTGFEGGVAFWEKFITIPYTQHVMNGREIMFASALVALVAYVIISLLTCRKPHDMDKLLHRGRYAVKDDQAATVAPEIERSVTSRILGWDRHFTLGDKWISGSLFGWSMLSFAVFVVVTVWNLAYGRWPLAWWSTYWWVYAIILPLIIGVITTIWFTWGVLRDMGRLFRALKTVRRDERDDGTVKGDHLLADEPTNSGR